MKKLAFLRAGVITLLPVFFLRAGVITLLPAFFLRAEAATALLKSGLLVRRCLSFINDTMECYIQGTMFKQTKKEGIMAKFQLLDIQNIIII